MKLFNSNSLLFTALVLVAFSMLFTACSKDDINEVVPTTPKVEMSFEDALAAFEADPLLDEVKDLTQQITSITKEQIIASGEDAGTIADFLQTENVTAIEAIFTNAEMSMLVLRHNELSYQLQQKYPVLYQDLEVSQDVTAGLEALMQEGAAARGCSGMYWVCATAAGAPTFVCMVSTLPSWILPAICYAGYAAALVICADTYC